MGLLIIAKEWFDKVNGNSYFSARIFIDGKVLYLPFQYGYGNQYEQEALKELKKHVAIPEEVTSLWQLRESCKYFSSEKQEKCILRDVKAWGKE